MPERGKEGNEQRKSDRMHGATVSEGVRVGDMQFERQHVGIGQHGRDDTRGEKAATDNPSASSDAEHHRDSGVGKHGWHIGRSVGAPREALHKSDSRPALLLVRTACSFQVAHDITVPAR